MKYKVYSDVGNFEVKTKCKDNYSVIRTLLTEGVEKMNPYAHVVEYNNSNYIVGDSNAVTITDIKLSKMDEIHRLSLFTTIHQVVPDNAEVDLYIGMPIMSYYNDEHRNKYEDFMKVNKVDIKVGDIRKKFTISNVTALPEGIGYMFNNATAKITGIIDIGHFTIDGGVFKDGMPILDSIFTNLNGANKLKLNLQEALNQKLIRNIPLYQIDEIIENGLYGADHDRSVEIIEEVFEDYLRMIIGEMINHGWEFDTIPIIFTGGGSIIMKNVINRIENFMVSENPILDNVDGFEQLEVMADEN